MISIMLLKSQKSVERECTLSDCKNIKYFSNFQTFSHFSLFSGATLLYNRHFQK